MHGLAHDLLHNDYYMFIVLLVSKEDVSLTVTACYLYKTVHSLLVSAFIINID